MKQFKSADEILEFAITEEELAKKFYLNLAKFVKDHSVADMLKKCAAEEALHKARLLDVKNGKRLLLSERQVEGLGIEQDIAPDFIFENLDWEYRQALIFAMKKEKASLNLYTQLASIASAADLRALLEELANEEAKHKLRFEIEYDKAFPKAP